jgi:hypothetical protein
MHISRGLLRLLCFALTICCLLGLNVYRSYSLGQYRTMYDNPIYRWRISIAVALSELRNPPLRGYVAYRSISDYLNQHGLALMEGEASPMPSYESVRMLVYDSDRLETLFREAAGIPIDYSLAPVPIIGNEKGGAAFAYWAFRLFGIHIISLWLFYFTLLALSVLAFFLAFWRSQIGMLLLTLYLIGHLYMLDIASTGHFQTIHNSRFLPALALLPSLHLALLALRGVTLRLGAAFLALCQTFLLFFLIFNRFEAAWQPLAVLIASLLSLPLRKLMPSSWHPRALLAGVGRILVAAWPGIMIIGGAISFAVYSHMALDPMAYATETRTHTFWDPLLVGTISASPELTQLYGFGQPPYSDTMGYFIARNYVMEHHDTASPIAVVQDGNVVGTFAMWNMGAFDAIQRQVFFEMMSEHPWLVLRAFAYDKPRAELLLLWKDPVLYRPAIFLNCILLAMATGALIWAFGAPSATRQDFIKAAWAVSLTCFLSLSTTFIYPSTDIPDAILLLVSLLLAVAACAPLLILMAAPKRY